MPSRKIVGTFDIGTSGESFATLEWHPDPEAMEVDLLQMADSFQNWSGAMVEARQVLIEDTHMHFVEEREPGGQKWIPLDPDYEQWKAKMGAGQGILSLTGDLEEAATSEDSWLITEDSIGFNIDALPKDSKGRNYGAINQFGSGKTVTAYHRVSRTPTEFIPGRGHVYVFEGGRLASDREQAVGERILKQFGPGEGRGNNLPARPFIGASLQAIEGVEQVFLRHLDNTVTDEWDDLGGAIGNIEEMGSNVLGTFPIIGHTRHGVPILRTPFGPRFGKR